MRRLRICHNTQYSYAQAVRFQTHRLLLRPREGHDVRIASSRLAIEPAHRIRWHRDVFDNSVAVVEFSDAADRLTISSDVVIEHYETAPLDFLVAEYAVHYPFLYTAEDRVNLLPYLHPLFPGDIAAVQSWLESIGATTPGQQSFGLLDNINRAIAAGFDYQVREEIGVQAPALTLQRRGGSCRDFAALFVEAARLLGLGSRFVSGYSHDPALPDGHASTHAWAEVYLPGSGWKGFDPTAGEMTGDRHIPVAVARNPEMVPPISGSFIGPPGGSSMQIDVAVVALPAG